MLNRVGKFVVTAALTCLFGVGVYEVLTPTSGRSNPGLANLKLPGYADQKVVYHVLDGGGHSDAKFKSTLGSIRNHLNAVGAAHLDVRVVLQGDGVELLRSAKSDSEIATAVDNLRRDGVRFLLCRNTLVSRNIDPGNDLYNVKLDDLVAAGVAEVTSLQLQGFAYLRL